MPKINVYLPDALAIAVREAGVPVSAVCQAALTDAVERVGRSRQAVALLRDPKTPAALFTRLSQGLQQRMTTRLIGALDASTTHGQDRISSIDLLTGLLEDEQNLAFRLLVSQGIDVDALRLALTTERCDEASVMAESGASLFARFTMPARTACASALEAVIEMGDNYLGCEHLLIGLVTTNSNASELLANNGVRAESLRQALHGAVVGVLHERSTAGERSSDTVTALPRRIEVLEQQIPRGNNG